MKANVYELEVTSSILAVVHGDFETITEIHIPSKKISFNEAQGSFHCFTTSPGRYEKATLIREINIPKAIAQAMIDYIHIAKKLEKTKKWFKRCVKGKK